MFPAKEKSMSAKPYPLPLLAFELPNVHRQLACWMKNGGDIHSLEWIKIDDSLSVADIGKVLGLSLPNTSIAVIKITGDIAPHIHEEMNSGAGVILGEADGFPEPAAGIDILLDDFWTEVTAGIDIILSPQIPHGFYHAAGKYPIYILFLDSSPVDDVKTTYLPCNYAENSRRPPVQPLPRNQALNLARARCG
ncbi:MAG: hypothetical protein HY053_05520 [Proteobacteria bacterium]|nr:hypothetical protein [Pseudomonadota bacterium]